MKISYEETVERVKAINKHLREKEGMEWPQIEEYWAFVFRKVAREQKLKNQN